MPEGNLIWKKKKKGIERRRETKIGKRKCITKGIYYICIKHV